MNHDLSIRSRSLFDDAILCKDFEFDECRYIVKLFVQLSYIESMINMQLIFFLLSRCNNSLLNKFIKSIEHVDNCVFE